MAHRTGASWTLKLALGGLALLAALGLAFAWWIPSNKELSSRLEVQAEEALGVPVHLGEARWQFFPLAVVVENAVTDQPAPIRIGRMVVEPVVRDLVHGRLRLRSLTVQEAVLPQQSVRALRIKPGASDAAPGAPLLEQLRFQRVTWITRRGTPLAFQGHLLFDASWRPRQGQIERVDTETPTRVAFRRVGTPQEWHVDAELGGGSLAGEVALAQAGDGMLKFSGQLALKAVELHGALAAFHRNSVLRGAASGTMELAASGRTLPELVRSLHTRTGFTMAPATLLRMDIDKAIRSFGKDRAGQTRMVSLAGQVETQNTAEGIVFRYRGLQAKGETFSARGVATIANRRVNAECTVDLAGGAGRRAPEGERTSGITGGQRARRHHRRRHCRSGDRHRRAARHRHRDRRRHRRGGRQDPGRRRSVQQGAGAAAQRAAPAVEASRDLAAARRAAGRRSWDNNLAGSRIRGLA